MSNICTEDADPVNRFSLLNNREIKGAARDDDGGLTFAVYLAEASHLRAATMRLDKAPLSFENLMHVELPLVTSLKSR